MCSIHTGPMHRNTGINKYLPVMLERTFCIKLIAFVNGFKVSTTTKNFLEREIPAS